MANAYMYATTKKPKSTATEAELEMFAQRLTGISHAPAMIVKKREVVEHRFADILNALYKLP